MSMDPELQKLLLETFQAELNEQLQNLTDNLLELEKKRLSAARRKEAMESAFRSAHNIKGAAKGVDINNVVEIAHHLESLLSLLKQAGSKPDQRQIDVSLEALDCMRDSMKAYLQEQDVDFDLADICQRLSQVAAGDQQANKLAGDEVITAEELQSGAAGSAVATESATDTIDTAKDEDKDALPELSEDGRKGESIRVTAEKLDQVGALADELQITKIEIDDHFASIRRLRDSSEELAKLWSGALRQVKETQLEALPANLRQLFDTSADIIADLNQTLKRTHNQMRNTSNNLNLVSMSLQTDIRTLRMVPASTVVRPLALTARTIAQELGKQVLLEIEGDDLEIDRIILEGIKDPLVHLLRNAIDHGLEDSSDRLAQGKPAEGHIKITIGNEGSHAVIQIQDDGHGINIDEVVNTAVRKGLIAAEDRTNLDEQELIDLIFRPGFSTKNIITEVSGRGVGLDVVQANLRNLKGSLNVQTAIGTGTTFTLRLPFTLSAERGIFVRSAGKRYAIPITAIERVVGLHSKDVVDVDTNQALLIDGLPVAIRDLASVLGEGQAHVDSEQDMLAVIVSHGRYSVALAVDAIEGEQEIVIKPLRPPIMSLPNIAGATVTGSGEVIMVLDTSRLVDMALEISGKLQALDSDQAQEGTDMPRILVVDDSITTRTLERNILESRGYEVMVATDGKEGWEMVENNKFDLVITDVEMPVMNGFELAERIKQNEKYRDLPVIIVTSLATDADKQRGIDVGADAYVVKSQFETMALLDIVKRLI